MESKWYLFPGQTYENTKISDRSHALHIKLNLWQNITGHLERKRLLAEELEKEKAHKRALKEGSDAMTRNWENSFENLQRKKQKEKEEAEKKEYEDKMKDYYRLKKGQQAVRDIYLEKARKKIYGSKGYAKDINSAYLLSETIYERDKQVEFNKFIKKHEEEEIQEKAKYLKGKHEEDVRNEMEEKRKLKEKEEKYSKVLLEQIKENKRCFEEQKEKQLKMERKILKKVKEELEASENFEKNQKIQKKMQSKAEKKKGLEEERKRKEVMEEEEREMYNVIDVCAQTIQKINCMRKAKEVELRREAITKREETAKRVFKETPDKLKNLDEQIRKAVEENDAKEMAKIQRIKELQEEDKRNKILGREEHLRKKEQEKRCSDEMKKWELLNIIKNEEATKKYDKEKRIQRWQEMLKVRKDLLDQMKEKQEILKEEKRIDEILSFVDLEAEDKMFFDYANEVLQLAKSKGRSTYPIEKVINKYKKDMNLK